MDYTRSVYESEIDQRVPCNYHPATESSSRGDYQGGLSALPDVDTIIEDIEFFLATTEPHGVKRKRPDHDNAFDHKITKRQRRVFESDSIHGTKRSCLEPSGNFDGTAKKRLVCDDRKSELDEDSAESLLDSLPQRPTHRRIVIKLNCGGGSTSTGSTVDAGNGYRNTDTNLEYDISPDVTQEDSYDESAIDIYKHAYCYCGEPRQVITPLPREMPTAEPMRRNLLKKLTMAAAGGGNVCCARYCCCYWQRVSGYAVYCDYC